MTVQERLGSLGTVLGEFNQGNFRGNRTKMEGANLVGGYCAGVCLDWARRVLQSSPDRDEAFLSYSSNRHRIDRVGGETRQVQTLRRMATAYAGQGASYVSETQKTLDLAQLSPLANAPTATYNIGNRNVTGVPIPNAAAKVLLRYFNWERSPFDITKEPAGVMSRDEIIGLIGRIRERADPQHQSLAAGGREWGQYASELDERFRSFRVTESRQVSRKLFSGIEVVGSADQKDYASALAWLGILLAEGIVDGCCTILGVGVPGETGHAVAIHWVGTDYRFFDPNFGAYKYDKRNLQIAIQYLFAEPYFTDEQTLDSDKPVYMRRDNANERPLTRKWTRMSYTIFRRA